MRRSWRRPLLTHSLRRRALALRASSQDLTPLDIAPPWTGAMVIAKSPSAQDLTTIQLVPTSSAGDSGRILVRFRRERDARQVCPKALTQLMSSDMTRRSSEQSG
jgi:hypothetical protein